MVLVWDGQEAHTVAAKAALYVPRGQLTHEAEDAAAIAVEYCPAPQSEVQAAPRPLAEE